MRTVEAYQQQQSVDEDADKSPFKAVVPEVSLSVFLGARFLELEEKVPGNRTTVVLFDLLHCKLGKWAQRSQRSAMISRQRVANARESVDDITQWPIMSAIQQGRACSKCPAATRTTTLVLVWNTMHLCSGSDMPIKHLS